MEILHPAAQDHTPEPASIVEADTTPIWIPPTIIILAVPFMLILFVLIGYLILD